MILNIIDNAYEFMTEVMENFKDFIISNSGNPLFYAGLFFIGIFLFITTYRALNK